MGRRVGKLAPLVLQEQRLTEEHEAPCIECQARGHFRNCGGGDDLGRTSCPRTNRCSESVCEFRRPIHVGGGITSLRFRAQPDRDLLHLHRAIAEMHYLPRWRARADLRRGLGGTPTSRWPGPGSNRRPSAFQADEIATDLRFICACASYAPH